MSKQKSKTDKADSLFQWQTKLLPWMIAVPSILVAVFIYLATIQLIRFNESINERKGFDIIGTVIPELDSAHFKANALNHKSYVQWLTLTKLEQESYNLRYKQAGMLLMSRIFTKYLGFFTGMILAIVGSVFIIGKLRESNSKVSIGVSDWKASVISSSPGIIFGFLGTVLMIATIVTHNEITVKDQPLYLNAQTILSTELSKLNNLQGERDSEVTEAVDDSFEILNRFSDE